FHRVLFLRSPEQPDSPSRGCTPLDRPHHDHLGHLLRRDVPHTRAPQFYALRFLLGVAEAGFFPGIVLYLTNWIPSRQRAKTLSLFLTSTALSGVIGNPL